MAVRPAVPGRQPGNGLRAIVAGMAGPFCALTSKAQYLPLCGYSTSLLPPEVTLDRPEIGERQRRIRAGEVVLGQFAGHCC